METNERFSQIIALFDAKKYESVLGLLLEIPESEWTWDTYYLQGTTLRFSHRLEDAEVAFECAFKKDPQQPLVMVALAEFKTSKRHYDEALSLLNRAIQVDSTYGDAYTQIGLIFFDQGHYSEALSYFDRAVGYLPRESTPLTLKGRSLVAMGDQIPAADCFSRALVLNPDDIEAHYFSSELALSMGDVSKTVSHLEDVLRLAPRHVKALETLGLLYAELDRHDDALRIITAWREIDPTNIEIQFRYATGLFQLKRYKDALVAFEKLEQQSSGFLVLTGKGLTQIYLKAYPEAMETLKKASALEPLSPVPFLYMGILFMNIAKYAQAVKAFEKSIACHPDNHEAYNAMATCLAELKQFPEAIAAHQKAFELSRDMAYKVFLGNTQKKSGDFEAAKATYKECIQADPKFKDAIMAMRDLEKQQTP